MVLEPAADTHTAQALGNELQFAVFAAGVVDLDQGAVGWQRRCIKVPRVVRRSVHEEQRQGMVRCLGHQIEGFCPGFFIDDDRQHLRREERPVVNRDDIDLVRQLLAGQCQVGTATVAGFDMFDFGLFLWRFREILLVAHGAPA